MLYHVSFNYLLLDVVFFNNTERMKYLNELCNGVNKGLGTSAVSKLF